MALFSKKEEKKEVAEKEQKLEKKDEQALDSANVNKAKLRDIIIAPRITEKTVKLMDKGVYTFNVRKDANKKLVALAIKEIYNVEPVKVRIVNYPEKKKVDYKTGKVGKKQGGKKALVYLKEGDKISII